MGLIEAFEASIIGLLLAFVLGQITVSLFPDLDATFSNTTVFGATGAVTLGLLVFLPLIFVVVVILRMIRDGREAKEEIGRTVR
ncbi:hypothetical protein LCGC14_2758840 [marine sediment metagenome]|uniref:Uncharacterized protein n=1 Tax=marine sediment metagenome TaxID=412755 RepID=A0A0F9B881_9ZZZZ